MPVHDGFEGETEMLKGVRQGWPQILSNLMTVVETDTVLDWPSPVAREAATAGAPPS
jgi:hypothetical protein